ncbi:MULTISPECIES: hypothetical protein [Stenotrophomonas]|uniref:Uncharacterized protein n=1 Tax=Stenotrophomonas aracearum TaxID=3003272 RepID=A0ABY9YDL8_9GAMM|nr:MULTISPECIES: hypothetical protein [unclassified Stenotrophomonas]WNH48964.1 hypothetical protein PDM28_01110 [Stenotrophomonas sp. A5588]
MNLEGILYAVNRRVAIKVELSPVVLYQFRLAAWRLNQNPSLLLRQMICSYIAMADNPKSIDLSVTTGP